jgi:Ran GTPase-activating protein (RanGAP) involved in mRNA processing and transport
MSPQDDELTLTREFLDRLVASDASLPHLKIKKISFSSDNNISLSDISAAIANNTVLQSISLDGILVDLSFLEALNTLPVLHEAIFTSTGLNVNVAKVLCHSLPWNRLTYLDLSDNPKLGPRGAKLLGEFLEKCPTLEKLHLENISLGHFGAQALALPPSLLHLNLSKNNLQHDGVWKLAERLPKSLVYLNLSYNACLDDGCLVIAKQLALLQNLKLLNLAGNDVGDFGVMSLAAAMTESTKLTELHLERNKITDDGTVALAQALPTSPLQKLNLASNQIGSKGCTALAESLGAGSCLMELDLSSNQIGDEGAGSFVELLDDMVNLVWLDLQDNQLTDARTRILDMLLKHRQATPKSPTKLSAGVSADVEVEIGESELHYQVLMNEHENPESVNNEKVEEARDLLMESEAGQAIELPLDYFAHLTDNFAVRRLLRYGAYGPLFSARDEAIDKVHFVVRRVALGPAGALQTVRDGITQELPQIRHEHLLPIVAYSTDSSLYCILHDVTGRQSLRDVLDDERRRKFVTWTSRIQILLDVARALHYLHTGDQSHKPTFHGDLNSGNVYVDLDTFSAQVSDGGLGRLLATDRGRFASGDVVFGSRGYRCPRYERGSCQYDSSSDVFSFGVVMSEILTGCRQRAKVSDLGWDILYDMVLTKKPLKTDSAAGPVPTQTIEALARIMLACLSPNLPQRPVSATLVNILWELVTSCC